MASQTAAISNKSCWDYFKWIPVINPALKGSSCEIDESLLASRVSAIAKVAFTLLVASIPMAAFSSIGSMVLIGLSICAQALPYLDSWAAERAADVKAVNEYLQMERPTESATDRIERSASAARLLVTKKGDLYKVNDQGYSLDLFRANFEVFKCLVDGGYDLHTNNGRPSHTVFKEIVKNKNPDYLEYVLRQKKVKVTDFTANEQVIFWDNLGSQKAGTLLVQYGFDVNIRGDHGYTPLLTVVTNANYTKGPMDSVVHVKTLLECGADKSLKVDTREPVPKDPNRIVQKNALQFTRNAEIRKLLE